MEPVNTSNHFEQLSSSDGADPGNGSSKGRLLKNAARMVSDRGAAFTLRRVIWRLHFERFERRRETLSRHSQRPSIIQFLGRDFELHHSNEGVSEELRLFGVHEPAATAEYLQTLSPGDHIIDVGANLGYYLLLAAQKVGATGRLLGFEPAPGVYEVLERNIRRSGFTNIQISPYAIGAASGTLEFYESAIPNWGSVFKDSRLQQMRSTMVEAKTIDELVRETPGFHPKALRMDVEGAELMVLAGAREVLTRYKPCLFIEFHNFALGWGAVKSALLDLRKLGYTSGALIERTWDQPWMSQWMRNRRRWKGSLDSLLARIESSDNPLTASTLILILKAPAQS